MSTTQRCVGWSMESLKNWNNSSDLPHLLYHPWGPACSSRNLRDNSYSEWMCPMPWVRRASKLPPREGHCRQSEHSCWTHYSLVLQKQRKSDHSGRYVATFRSFLAPSAPLLVMWGKLLWSGKSFWHSKLCILPTIPNNMRILFLQYQRTHWALVSYKVKLYKPLLVNSTSRLE